jgi:asparagine synthase (glutamine-hydrolysing)
VIGTDKGEKLPVVGIAGYAFIKKETQDRSLLKDMLQSIKHKPWHRMESFYSSLLHIGRVHLGIFNPERQPIFNENRKLFAFMDGKIYGYEADYLKLRQLGHKFSAGNDVDFCLHAYEQFGRDFVKRLNGSFLLVIGDIENRKVLIVSDRFGTRPLYYLQKKGSILFASEVKAIIEDKSFVKKIDYEALSNFFVFGEILGDRTFFEGVKVLPNASILTWTKNGISISRYWDMTYRGGEKLEDIDFTVDELVKKFVNAVSNRLKEPYKYTVALSGGLDSRSVLGAASQTKKCQDVTAFTFGTPSCDEIRVARTIADKLNVRHRAIEYDPSLLTKYFDEVIQLNDGMDYIALCFLPYVFGNVRNFADVYLQGFALDLLLGGSLLNNPLLKVKTDAELAALLYSKKTRFPENLLSNLLTKGCYQKIKGKALKSLLTTLKESRGKTFADKADYFSIVNHVRRHTLMGSVINRNYVEEALPTLDNEFIELITTIPANLRLNYKIYLKFLRKVAPKIVTIPYQMTYLPPTVPFKLWKLGVRADFVFLKTKSIIWRLSKGRILLKSRHGYLHVDDYIRQDHRWRRVIRETLLNENSEIYKRDFLQLGGVKKLIMEHESGKRNHWMMIAYIVTFELFLRDFF